ncbi:MAG: MobA/MobL family protein [Syntrophorhabdus sp.]|nr:MobA/MobL family protein [Syntrophorhabdus sp.]
MPDKTWKPWNDIDYSSSKHNPDVRGKAYYDSKPSKSIGGGANMPELGMDDAMYLNDPADPSPSLSEVTVIDEIASGITKEDRLAIVREWVQVKERELARRRDARFTTTCFVPIPNELSQRDAVRVGHEICRALFDGDHLYSFSVHAKESVVKKLTGNTVATYSRQNNHIHILFSERRLSDGKKGTGASRKFKQRDALRKLINSALADSLTKRGYKITANTGAEKKTRVSRAQQRAREREQQQALAVSQVELEVAEKRNEIGAMDKEIAELEREVTSLEKGRQVPSFSKVHANLDKAERGMKDLEIQQQLDRINQRSQARLEADKKYRSGQDKNRSSRTRENVTREPDARDGIDR